MTNKPLISCQSCSGKALVFFALLILPLVVTALQQQTQRNLPVAVVVPGFLTGSSDFNGLCTHLANECGIRAVPVFMPAWHWIPCLGGRSVRPILERIDFTVQHLIANQGDISKIPPYEYTLKDFWDDFWTNPGGIFRVGGSDEVEEYPVVQPHGRFNLPATLPENVKIGLVGHSAGGWISRVYLSDRSYGGKAYHGSRFVHSLVTLGTPHRESTGAAFAGIRWVDQEDALVPSLAVGSTGFDVHDWGSFTVGAYRFCGFEDGNISGDGVTPLESAFDYRGAKQLAFERVHHISWADTFGGKFVSKELTKDHAGGTPWYGSPEIVRQWGQFLKPNSDTL